VSLYKGGGLDQRTLSGTPLVMPINALGYNHCRRFPRRDGEAVFGC